MMKKTLLVGALSLLASGAALANGFYAGLGAGVLNLNEKAVTSGADGSTTQYSGDMGVNGTLMAGYSFDFANRMNLSLEAFTNYTSAKATQYETSDGFSSDTRLKYVYGFRALPGYQITDSTDVHAIVGYARGQFTQEVSYAAEGVTTDESGASNTFSLNGYQFGLGTCTAINDHLGIRTDVIYTSYQDKTFEDGAGSTFKVTPSTLEANVAAMYKFG